MKSIVMVTNDSRSITCILSMSVAVSRINTTSHWAAVKIECPEKFLNTFRMTVFYNELGTLHILAQKLNLSLTHVH